MSRPARMPTGLHLARAAKSVSRAFDDTLVAAGGSRSVWLVLLALKTRPTASQRDLAEAVGIRGATLTHHLDAMERAGLVIRGRDPGNRRQHVVGLTAEGDAMFHRLRGAASGFDRRLRSGLSEKDLDRLGVLLDRLAANVGAEEIAWGR